MSAAKVMSVYQLFARLTDSGRSEWQRRPARVSAGWLWLALGALLVGLPPTARAEDRWLLLSVRVGDRAKDLEASALTNRLETALRSAHQAILPNSAAASSFEAVHSSEPVHVGSEELTRLSRSVSGAARHLALGELPEAQRAMEGLNALSEPVRDYLNREPARARKIFNNCYMAAYLLERAEQHQPAVQQMVDCSRSFPGFRPEGRAYPSEVRRLFEEAMLQLSQLQPTSLRVQSAGRTGCAVRLNGMEAGKSPLRMPDVRPGLTRIQLECEPGVAGRIHNIELKPGDNDVSIDPLFDSAVRTRDGLWLGYPNEAERDRRAARDAEAIGRVLGVKRVVMLWSVAGVLGTDVSVRPVGLDSAGEVSRISYTPGSGYAGSDEAQIARALMALAVPQPTAAGVVSASGDDTAARKTASAPEQAAEPRKERRGAQTQQHAAAGAILAVVGGASITISWVVYAERQPVRRVLDGKRNPAKYRKLGVIGMTTGAVGMTLLSASEFFWLPDDPGVPGMAWATGALGLGLGVTALALGYSESDCAIGDTRLSCQHFWSDHFFGPMLAMHALPLMAVPLWYGLRILTRPAGMEFGMNVGEQGLPMLSLRGVF